MKHVESWWVEELPNGVFHLLINTTERWMYFERMLDTHYRISKNEKEDFEDLIIPEFLPKEKNKRYIPCELQNKDQISFYWIPYDRDSIKTRKIILKSDERKNN